MSPVPVADVPVSKGYVLCGEPRAGTNLLCQALQSTGVLGMPEDYFNGAGLRKRLWPDYPEDRERQFQAIMTRGATPNGVYGFKIFSAMADRVRATRWSDRLPGLHFVHVRRDDMLAQAISYVRALQSGQYRASAAARPEPRYDRRAIRHQLHQMVYNQARWQAFFIRNDIVPLRLVYEDFSADMQAAVDRIAAHIELEGAGTEGRATVNPEAMTLAIQRDGISAEWRARFLQESRKLSDLGEIGREPLAAPLIRKLLQLRR